MEMIDKIINAKKFRCTGCTACYSGCPTSAITMRSDKEGFLYPAVDYNKCVECGLCKKICPTIGESSAFSDEDSKVEAYAAYNKDSDVRFKSSSGGVFSLLAEEILAQHGVVYGAAMGNDLVVRHVKVETLADLEKLRGSKYVQSALGDSFRSCKEMLEKGRAVLFSGTPCQIGGLKSYLRKEYENLYTVDIICHGVPSPLVWKKYIEAENATQPIRTVSFRCKSAGWKNFSFRLEKQNGTFSEEDVSKNPFVSGFLNNLYLRKSCYNCSFKLLHRCSNMTIADFWGVDEIMPELDDDLGTSLVFIHDLQGSRMLRKISSRMVMKKTSIEDALKRNNVMVESVGRHKKREVFFKKMAENKNGNIIPLIEKYAVYHSLRKKISIALRAKLKSIFKSKTKSSSKN